MNHVVPVWWQPRSHEELEKRADVIVRAMRELWDEAELALGPSPHPDGACLTLEQHRAKFVADLRDPSRWTAGSKPVLFDVLDREEAAWRRYGYVQGAMDLLRERRAPPEPVLARLDAVRADDPRGTLLAMLDGLRCALGYGGHGEGIVSAFRDTTRRLNLLTRKDAPTVRLPAHPLHGVMRRALVRDDRRLHEPLRWRAGDVWSVTVTPNDPGATGGHAVGLLKTHLDLLDVAHAHGGDAPRFWYDLPRALARLGYLRQSHGAFDARTLREHHRRVVALANLTVLVDRPEGAPPAAPFWIVEAHQNERGAARDVHHRLLLRPGAWWAWTAAPRPARALPREVLCLPTDGKGHEVNRLIVRLAVELTARPAEQALLIGRAPRPTIGALLEAAGVATLRDLTADAARRGNRARRLRTYLVGADGEEGAFAALRRLGVADVRPADERALWSSGPNWLPRFWNAPLRVAMPHGADAPGALVVGDAVPASARLRPGA